MSDPLLDSLRAAFPADRLKTRAIDLYSYGGDASFYFLLPRAVVLPVSVEEIRALFQIAARCGTHITFRAAGTSLSGQATTDGVLADLSRHWGGVRVEREGELVRVYPGAIGGAVNQQLRKWGRKIGPDPASINAAMMGGIISNNSSGMCCGVAHNAYHTLQFIKFVLPDGNVYDTENLEDYARFAVESREIFDGIASLKAKIRSNTELEQRIRRKYLTKNTIGYGLNAFLDYDHPLDIFAHLLVGAEGTLAFICEAVLKTLPDLPAKKTGLLFFENPVSACNAIFLLTQTGAAALEFMDRASLRSIENLEEAPADLKNAPSKGCVLLCEYQAEDVAALKQMFEAAEETIGALPLLYPAEFTEDPAIQAAYWKLRKGLYPSIAAARAKGASVLLEDVTFPIERLGAAVEDLQELLQRYGYGQEAVIFGHAKDGNLHFVVAQSMNTPEEIKVFKNFNEDLARLVVGKYDGCLKGEHGTGRQFAPFIETEWGEEAYGVMKALKKLVDPSGILNAGVLINEDKYSYLQNLKGLAVVEEEVDKCVECGYCERRCPSRDYTMTPRRRISARRAMERLKAAGQMETYREILKDYEFDGMDTCAVDGMCAIDCPVHINTGDLIKRLRRESHSETGNKRAVLVAKHFKIAEQSARLALKVGFAINGFLGPRAMSRLTGGMKALAPGFPQWQTFMTAPPPPAVSEPADAEYVYFPSCVDRMMGADAEKNTNGVMEVFLRVAKKAGVIVALPSDAVGVCCGQLFSSKGYAEAFQYTANETVQKLWRWSLEGALPIVTDVTSCTFTLQHCRSALTEENQACFDQLRIMDVIEFAAAVLLPRLKIVHKKKKIVFHPVCSAYKMNLTPALEQIGKVCADRADIPVEAGCCGMAGDRGFYYPELIRAATRKEAAEVGEEAYDGYYSSAKTCEQALTSATGKNYRSVLQLLDEVS